MVRRIAFLSGLVLGAGLCAWALGAALAYLFTGKFLVIQGGRDRPLTLRLVDVHGLYETPTVIGEEG